MASKKISSNFHDFFSAYGMVDDMDEFLENDPMAQLVTSKNNEICMLKEELAKLEKVVKSPKIYVQEDL